MQKINKYLYTCTLFLGPTPPGTIIITLKTNSSLLLEWPTPSSMDGASQIGYHITYQRDGGEALNLNSTVNKTELANLSSGTLYNITLVTVGPQNLQSTAVHTSTFTCKFHWEDSKEHKWLLEWLIDRIEKSMHCLLNDIFDMCYM